MPYWVYEPVATIKIPAERRCAAMGSLVRLEYESIRWWHRLLRKRPWICSAASFEQLHAVDEPDPAKDLNIDVYPQYRRVWIHVLHDIGLADEAERLADVPIRGRIVEKGQGIWSEKLPAHILCVDPSKSRDEAGPDKTPPM